MSKMDKEVDPHNTATIPLAAFTISGIMNEYNMNKQKYFNERSFGAKRYLEVKNEKETDL